MNLEAVIGLEVHAQLKTNSKIFCACSTAFGAPPNTHTCPVCLGMPGVLPVLNKKVVEYTLRMALATNCQISRESRFARKNYFYPDLPKGYKISQYELTIAQHGLVHIQVGETRKRIGITRAHMEEDAGKLVHGDTPDTAGVSMVDLNRACTPLLEIVSEPDMRSSDEAIAYLKKLHQIVVYLGVCDGNLEEGSFRCVANVSVRPSGQQEFGTRAELKNINSFRFIKQAIDYEVERQIDLIESGGKVIQETRLFDSNTGMTRSMRGKEEAHDYRYFPDPDLVPLVISQAWIDEVRATLPELPDAKRNRFVSELGLTAYDAEVLAADRGLADYFDACVQASQDAKACANWVMGDVLRKLKESETTISDVPVTPDMLAGLISRIADHTISGKIAKTVFEKMWQSGQTADRIIEAEGLKQVTDTRAIEGLVDQVIADHPAQVAEYLGGKEKLIGFFVGKVMQASQGKANPGLVNQMLKEKLGAGG